MKKKTAKIILDAAIVIFSLLLIVSAVAFIAALREYKRGETVYSDIVKTAVIFEDDYIEEAETEGLPASEETRERVTGELSTEISSDGTAPAAVETAETSAPARKKTLKVDFTALQKVNPDIIAWIYSPDTPISYPVVRSYTEDDYGYYLKHLPDGSYNKLGSIFTDCRVEPFNSLNTILYGHNMLNSSMFSTLLGYRKQSYYDEHPVIYIATTDRTFSVRLFAAMTVKASQSPYTVDFDGDGIADTTEKTDKAAYTAFLDDLKARSDFKCGVIPTSDDKICTLSTCDNTDNSSRYILYGIIE